MTILEDFLQYKDANGFIQPGIGQGSFNGILYTCIAMMILEGYDQLDAVYWAEFNASIDKCQVEPGLYARTPERVGGQEAFDDYVGLCTPSVWAGISFRVLKYGKKHNYIYNNINPGKFTFTAWLGRMPQVIAHMYYGNCERPNAFLRFWWALSIFWAARSKPTNGDAFMLSWLMIKTFEWREAPSWLGRQAVKYWDKRVIKTFGPEGLRNMAYLNGNKEHPITKYWRR